MMTFFPIKSAIISDCGKYRYMLSRSKPLSTKHAEKRALFVMLNPSTADSEVDDSTIRRCMAFANGYGLTGINVVNLFAYRATSPKDLLKADDPIGEESWYYLREALKYSTGPVICGWGNHGNFMDRDLDVLGYMDELGITPKCLGVTKLQQPRHPLYVPACTGLVDYKGRHHNHE